MRLKKSLGIILSLLMVLSCVTCAVMPVSAAEGQTSVSASSNYLRSKTQTVNVGDEFEVPFMVPVDMIVENFEFGVNYDAEKLEYVGSASVFYDCVINDNAKTFDIYGDASNIYGYEIYKGEALITLTFKAIAEGEANVDLQVQYLRRMDVEGAEHPVVAETEIIEEPPVEETVIVVGTPADIFGTVWDATNENNIMTKTGDVYTKTYTVSKAYTAVQLKAYVSGTWIGDETANNVTFNLTGPGEFTVIYDPTVPGAEEIGLVTVTGDIVEISTEFIYSTVYAAGNGDGDWLDGVNWVPNHSANEMTEVQDDVWEIEFEYIPAGFDRQIKFAIDGAWTHNFGANSDEKFEPGKTMTAEYNGGNISFDTGDFEYSTVRVQLDLRDFDFTTKSGAKYTIWITDSEAPVMGDVNSDGVFNTNDVTALQRYLVHFDETIDETVADANGDGKINIRDVTYMQRVLAGVDFFK